MPFSSGKPLSYEMVEASNHKKSCTLLSLKDYLRDKLSSCSSSGFISLPRRQCCLQVQPRSLTKSVFQKALEAVFSAIKFPRCKANKGSRSFWKRAFEGGITTFGSSVNGNSCSDSVLTCSLTDAEMERSVTNSATVDSRGKQDWTNEKEQFSPVSVLDCPIFDDDDDDEEITSPFNSPSCSTLEGAEHKHIQKSRHFNCVASLKPLDLDKSISQSELLEDEPMLLSITSAQKGNSSDLFHGSVEENVVELLTHVKRSIPSVSLRMEVETFLFDFFKQSIWENIDIENDSIKRHLCKVAEDWICGQPQEEYVMSLQTRKGREIYVKEMDKCGTWRTFDEEIQQLVMEIEVEFTTTLVNELVVDLAMCYF